MKPLWSCAPGGPAARLHGGRREGDRRHCGGATASPRTAPHRCRRTRSPQGRPGEPRGQKLELHLRKREISGKLRVWTPATDRSAPPTRSAGREATRGPAAAASPRSAARSPAEPAVPRSRLDPPSTARQPGRRQQRPEEVRGARWGRRQRGGGEDSGRSREPSQPQVGACPLRGAGTSSPLRGRAPGAAASGSGRSAPARSALAPQTGAAVLAFPALPGWRAAVRKGGFRCLRGCRAVGSAPARNPGDEAAAGLHSAANAQAFLVLWRRLPGIACCNYQVETITL